MKEIIQMARELALRWANWNNNLRRILTSGPRPFPPEDEYPEPPVRLVLPANGKCLFVQEGDKGGPIGSFNPTPGYGGDRIVFLSRQAPVGKDILVVLQEIEGKKDRRGFEMYRAMPGGGYVDLWSDKQDGTAVLYRVHFNWLLEAEKVDAVDEMDLDTDRVIETAFSLDDNRPVLHKENVCERIDVSAGYPVYKQPGRKERVSLEIARFEADVYGWGNIFSVVHSSDERVAFKLYYGDGKDYTYISSDWGQMPEWWRRMYDARYPVCQCGRARIDARKHAECEACRIERCLAEFYGHRRGQAGRVYRVSVDAEAWYDHERGYFNFFSCAACEKLGRNLNAQLRVTHGDIWVKEYAHEDGVFLPWGAKIKVVERDQPRVQSPGEGWILLAKAENEGDLISPDWSRGIWAKNPA